MPVWCFQGTLQRIGQKCQSFVYLVCLNKSGDGKEEIIADYIDELRLKLDKWFDIKPFVDKSNK